jgi:hypothetical protein
MKRTVIILLLLCFTGGCAVFNRENTRALNFVEKQLVPADPLAKKLTYPITIPVSIVAVTIDMFLLHPLFVVPDALDDTNDWLWSRMEWEKEYFTTAASVVPRTAATPLAFAGSFLGRSTFDMPHHRAVTVPAKDAAEETRQLQEAEKALAEQRFDDAYGLAQQVLKRTPYRKEALEVMAAVLLERGEIRELAGLHYSLSWSEQLEQRFIRALAKATAEDKVRLLFMVERGRFYAIRPGHDYLQALIALLDDDDRALKMKALAVLGMYQQHAAVKAACEEVAAADDPVLAAEAQLRLGKK